MTIDPRAKKPPNSKEQDTTRTYDYLHTNTQYQYEYIRGSRPHMQAATTSAVGPFTATASSGTFQHYCVQPRIRQPVLHLRLAQAKVRSTDTEHRVANHQCTSQRIHVSFLLVSGLRLLLIRDTRSNTMRIGRLSFASTEDHVSRRTTPCKLRHPSSATLPPQRPFFAEVPASPLLAHSSFANVCLIVLLT
ncbi:hypothetical protein BDP55DRAFT_625762 [Colletotrichum godetiae]|uniref:Uncharacterized protein n=1 Tax=Colletotrichum godetiae TaxID=1209918 RepID=A0AAJ0B2P9_9PEZI|nr:uncharacterized protein BDP55DRAFT_625762 [Colletotrichum godetiae]KAK1701556.1 hypothetical protein BDP55DRAFT_625762 [Colletotrichum godetiae]